MKLVRLVTRYITFKQSMGMRFREEAKVLKAFCRLLGDIDIEKAKHSTVLTFIKGNGLATSFQQEKFQILTRFYRFAVARGYVDFSPLPKTIPKRRGSFTPHIYNQEELRRLIGATKVLDTPLSPLQAMTFRALLLILYGTGIRIGEALSLTLADVDLSENLIVVRDSKFYKSRLVPIGPRLTAELSAYAKKRCRLPRPREEHSAFFATRTGNPLPYDRVKDVFPLLRRQAGLHRNGNRHQPRIHDLRHSFAVHRLVAWYREGKDVQRLLPQLSTYLGHVDIAETQPYLSMTPELLREANHRFEQYVLSEVNHA